MKVLRVMGYPLVNNSTWDRNMLEEAKAIKDLGHEMHLLYDGPKPEELPDFTRELEESCPMHWFPYPQTERRPYSTKINKLLKKEKYDIVHTCFEPAASLVSWNAFRRRVPVIMRTIASFPILSDKSALHTLLEKLNWKRQHIPYDWIVCVSQGILDYVRDHFGYDTRKMSIVYNATDVNRFKPPNDEIQPKHIKDQKHIRLTYLGRLEPIKGIPHFIDALELLSQSCPNIQAQIVGDGTLYQELKNTITNKGLSGTVTMPGRRHDLLDIFYETDVYVHPSYMEGCPASVIEAMACGVPVVASDVGGIKEIIRNETDGLLVTPGDPVKIKEAVVRLIEDEKLVRDIRQQARQRIVDVFDMWVNIEKEIQLYETLYNRYHKR